MFQTFKNAWKVPELRKKMLFTLLILLLYRIGAVIPVPFVSSDKMHALMSMGSGSMSQYLNIMSGEAFSRANLFALAVSPYITAQIIMQLLTIAIPALEKLSKLGEEGQKKIQQITRYVSVGLGPSPHTAITCTCATTTSLLTKVSSKHSSSLPATPPALPLSCGSAVRSTNTESATESTWCSSRTSFRPEPPLPALIGLCSRAGFGRPARYRHHDCYDCHHSLRGIRDQLTIPHAAHRRTQMYGGQSSNPPIAEHERRSADHLRKLGGCDPVDDSHGSRGPGGFGEACNFLGYNSWFYVVVFFAYYTLLLLLHHNLLQSDRGCEQSEEERRFDPRHPPGTDLRLYHEGSNRITLISPSSSTLSPCFRW